MAYEYGCLMVDFKIPNWNKLTNMINKDDIYNDETGDYGLETEPHCTVVFGFDKKYTHKDIIKYISIDPKDISVRVFGVDVFSNGDYDVVKLNCESEQLSRLNRVFMEKEKFDIHTDFPDYKPHMTVAYTKPGTGKKYVGKFSNSVVIKPYRYSFSHPTNKKVHFQNNMKK